MRKIAIEMTEKELLGLLYSDGYSDGLFLDESNDGKVTRKLYEMLRQDYKHVQAYCEGLSAGLKSWNGV